MHCVCRFILVYTSQAKHHPDPNRVILSCVVERLETNGAHPDDGVCWDVCSLFKPPFQDQEDDRTEEQKESHTRGMMVFNRLFSDQRFRTLVVTETPPGGEPLSNRGWPLVQIFTSAFAGIIILDDPEVIEIFLEKFFMLSFKDKIFTNAKSDPDIVANLFKSLIYERAGMSALDESKDHQIMELKDKIKRVELALDETRKKNDRLSMDAPFRLYLEA